MQADRRRRMRRGDVLERRQFLAALGAAGAAGLAGCEMDLETGSDGPGLSSAALEELALAEIGRTTVELGESGEDEQSVTGTLVGYHRGPERGQPTAVEAFAGTVNETDGAGPTALVTPGGDEVPLALGRERAAVAPDAVRLVAPAPAFGDDGVSLEGSLLLVPIQPIADYGGAWLNGQSEDPEVSPHKAFDLDESNHALVPVEDFFPGDSFLTPSDDGDGPPVGRWTAGEGDPVEQVLVVTGERTIPGVFGMGLEKDGRLVEDGATVDADATLLAAPADQFVGGAPIWNWEEIDDSEPAPLGGATFGLGVFLGPAGSAFPRGHWDLEGAASVEEVFQSEAGLEALAEFVLDSPGDIVWKEPPIHPPPQIWGDDQKRDSERLTATFETERGRVGAGLHVAEVTVPIDGGDDLTGLVVGGQTTPIGVVPAGWIGSRDTMADLGRRWPLWLDAGAELVGTAAGRIARKRPSPQPSYSSR